MGEELWDDIMFNLALDAARRIIEQRRSPVNHDLFCQDADLIARALLRRPSPAGGEWRTIDSYPRKKVAYDEIVLLAWCGQVIPGRYISNAGYKGFQPLSLVPRPHGAEQPTHWRPLPSPPEEREDEKLSEADKALIAGWASRLPKAPSDED